MKRLLLIAFFLMLTGCVAYPAYDGGYYPDYGPYPYGYFGPDVNVFVTDFHGGHRFHGDHGFRGGGHDFDKGHGFHGRHGFVAGGHDSRGGGHGFAGGGHWGGRRH